MKHWLLYCLTALLIACAMPASAGFWTKKAATGSAISMATTGNHQQLTHTEATHLDHLVQKAAGSDSRYPFMMYFAAWGWLGILSFLFGVAGLFNPGWSIAAVLFGALGIGRWKRNNSMAIAGLVLGLVVIALVIYGGFEGFPLY